MKTVVLGLLFLTALVVAQNTSWDYILYTTRWPFVASNGYPVPSNITTFEIHGLWPNRNDTTYPSYCTNEAFDIRKIESLYSMLVEYWHDFDHPTDPSYFWSHEWTKHGTCASSDTLLGSQYLFFKAAITLRQTVFPLEQVLANKGITPSSNPISLSQFQNVITGGIGAFPLMTCHVDGYGNVYVDRIQFCVNKQLQLFTCNEAITQQITQNGQCGNGNVIYAPLVH